MVGVMEGNWTRTAFITISAVRPVESEMIKTLRRSSVAIETTYLNALTTSLVRNSGATFSILQQPPFPEPLSDLSYSFPLPHNNFFIFNRSFKVTPVAFISHVMHCVPQKNNRNSPLSQNSNLIPRKAPYDPANNVAFEGRYLQYLSLLHERKKRFVLDVISLPRVENRAEFLFLDLPVYLYPFLQFFLMFHGIKKLDIMLGNWKPVLSLGFYDNVVFVIDLHQAFHGLMTVEVKDPLRPTFL
jgi:hypothetical protein